MTSNEELTAEGETSPLFTDFSRAKQVINLDLSHPEICTRQEEGKHELKAASGLCSSVASPLAGFSSSASPHSRRVPWRRRAQEQDSPGRTLLNNDETRNCAFWPHAGQNHNSSVKNREIHIPVESWASSNCDGAPADERKKTFEWMKVKRSQHREGEFLQVSAELQRRKLKYNIHLILLKV